jgi:hypothetical protein
MQNRTDILGDATLRVVGDETDTLGEFATEILGDGPLSGGDDESGAWLHKLNPTYWFKSSDEQAMIDKDREFGKQNVQAQKDLEQRNKEIAAAEQAVATATAARAAQAQTAEAAARLQALKEQVSGAFVGADDSPATAAAKDDQAKKIVLIEDAQVAAKKNHRRAGAIAAKLEAGERLTPDELERLKGCLRMCKNLRAIHKQLHASMAHGNSVTSSGYRDADKVERSAPSASFLGDFVGNDDFMGGYGQKRWVAMIAIAATKPRILGPYMKKHNIRLNASQLKHLRNMSALTVRKMTKARGARMRMSGIDTTGFGFGDIWGGVKKVATLAAVPFAGAAYLAYKGAQYTGKALKWGGQKLGIIDEDSSPAAAPSAAAARSSRIRAIRARRLAAIRRKQAAMAATAEARREAQAAAEAAQAEADAAQQEAEAEDAQAQAEEADVSPPPEGGDGGDTSEGDFVGAKVLTAGDFVGGWVGAVPAPAKKIVKAAASNTPTGKKIRAGATVVRAAKAGNPKAKAAIAKVAAKAKAGHPQAKKDLNAIKAGNVALKAKATATKKVAFVKKMKAANAKGIAVRKKIEAVAAGGLARTSRRRALAKVAKVERKAAAGHKPSKAIIAKTVAKARTGDKKAKTAVAALKLVRNVRVAAKSPQEAKRLKAAGRLVKKGLKGNKKAIKQIKIVQAAAKKGQPNAKRAVARLKTAAHLEKAVRTGKVVAPSHRGVVSPAARKARYAKLKAKAIRKGAKREDAIAAAREAQALGLNEEAAALTKLATERPSATQKLKDVATVAAAARQGDTSAQTKIDNTLAKAEEGDPGAINGAGHLAAVKTLESIKRGEGMPPQMAEAVNLVQRGHAGDPEAQRTIERASTSAESGDKAGVAAAVALTGAAALLTATATRPEAKAQLVDEANKAQGLKLQPADVQRSEAEFGSLYAKVQSGDATREEAERARQLAMALHKPNLAAEISALMPPLDLGDPRSSLPDQPLAPINTVGDLVKESLRALFFATSDPLQNYREGVQSRGAPSMDLSPSASAPTEPALEPTSSSGWGLSNISELIARMKAQGAPPSVTANRIRRLVGNRRAFNLVKAAYGGRRHRGHRARRL